MIPAPSAPSTNFLDRAPWTRKRHQLAKRRFSCNEIVRMRSRLTCVRCAARHWILIPIAGVVALLAGAVRIAPPARIDVLTNRYDNARTGWNPSEPSLNTSNVNAAQFGKLFEREVDGDIYAQPLIRRSVRIPGVGPRDVMYVATANNSLYAYDAELQLVSK